MRITTAVLLTLCVIPGMGCSKKEPKPFEMTVDKVDELNGLILRGISISGKVTSGCIANDNAFIVQRNGQQVLKEITRVVNVEGLEDADSFTGEVVEGDYVTFYIPDGKKQDVAVGDVVSSSVTSCTIGTSKR